MCFDNQGLLYNVTYISFTKFIRFMLHVINSNKSKVLVQNKKKKIEGVEESFKNIWTWVRESNMKTKKTKSYGATITFTFQEH
jgi:hypothetical protein